MQPTIRAVRSQLTPLLDHIRRSGEEAKRQHTRRMMGSIMRQRFPTRTRQEHKLKVQR
jgi:hypothetical protein